MPARVLRQASGRTALLLLLLLTSAGGGALAQEKVQPFTGTTLGGETFDLAAYLGKVPILLDFGSIYCSSCVTSIPHMITLQNRYGPEKLRVVGINLDTYGLARVRRFFGTFQRSINFPIVLDLELTVSRTFHVTTLPTYVLVDASGAVAATFVGYDDQTARRIDEAVRTLVEEGAVSPAVAQTREDVVLLSPDNFTKTYTDHISVVGLTGGHEGPFTLRLNGGSERQAIAYGRMFWVLTPLSLGSNFIEIRYRKGGSEATQAVVIFREPRMGEGLEIAFPEYKFHTPDREARCSPCHAMDAEGAGEIEVMTTFCLRCHSDLGGVAYVHGPIPVGGCSPCHDFTSKPHKYDLVTEGSDLCFSCHDDIRDKFARPYLHGPVAMGLCTLCHSPHSSPFKFQIRLPEGDMCLSCHEELKALSSRFVQHVPFQEGRCSGCHEPHAGDNAEYLLKETGGKLCTLCHDEEAMARHRHPVGRAPKFAVAGMTVDAAGNLTCRSCHEPHATDSEKLSPVAGGCAGCHKM